MRCTAGLILGSLLVSGCGERSAPSPQDPHATDPVHVHERGKMLISDAGPYHALLTAHLAPKDNELDVFFETSDDKDPRPVAIPYVSFMAHVRRIDEPQAREVTFHSAPADERPAGEKAGMCSHFVAKVDWVKADDTLSVTCILELGGERRRVSWEPFVPRKYAHHEE